MDVKPSAALPAVPPAPEGETVHATARGLATLIAGLESAVLSHRSDDTSALVVVLDGRVIDAVAETSGGVVKGVEVLDELTDVSVGDLKVVKVDARLARVLPAYWRAPGAAREVIKSFIQPGRRGAIAVTAPSGTGLLLFDEEGIVASYRDGEHSPGSSALDELLADPDVVLSPRSEAQPVPPPSAVPAPSAEHGETPPPAPAPSAATTGPSPMPGPGPGPVPGAPPRPPVAPGPPSGPPPGPPGPPPPPGRPTMPPPGPPGVPPPSPPATGDQVDSRREAIIDLIQARLQRLSGPVEEPFKSARAVDDLLAAADRIRGMQLRMVNPLTLQGIADDAAAIARGERPQS